MQIFGITGWKNSGKTALVSKLVNALGQRGFKVSTVKHTHCDFDVDTPGTDSYKHRQAGAHQVMLAGNRRWALMKEVKQGGEAELAELLKHMDPVDLVIVEGFKMGDQPKIQVVRPQNNTEPLSEDAQPIVAIASDEQVNPSDYGCSGPLLDLNDPEAIASFIVDYCKLSS